MNLLQFHGGPKQSFGNPCDTDLWYSKGHTPVRCSICLRDDFSCCFNVSSNLDEDSTPPSKPERSLSRPEAGLSSVSLPYKIHNQHRPKDSE
jgi:LSD1 subclass zinc finger protein